MRKTILCDVDGVVADMDKEWLKMYNRDYNDNLTTADWTTWDIHKLVKPECGKLIYDYLFDPHLYDDVMPVDGSIKGIEILRKSFNVVFVTSGMQFAKIRWLERYGLIKDWKYPADVIIAHNKALIKGDYLIDDATHNCKAFVGGLPILFDQPWNQDYEGFRAHSWKQIVSSLCGEEAWNERVGIADRILGVIGQSKLRPAMDA